MEQRRVGSSQRGRMAGDVKVVVKEERVGLRYFCGLVGMVGDGVVQQSGDGIRVCGGCLDSV